MVTITENAKDYMKSVSNGGYVTLAVKGGGCSGFQYVWGISKTKDDKLKQSGIDIIDNILLLDSLTVMYVIGSTIDYITELGGSFLTIVNPTAKSSCGCGESFAI
jgi:iron-sulfur cluster insertion protein